MEHTICTYRTVSTISPASIRTMLVRYPMWSTICTPSCYAGIIDPHRYNPEDLQDHGPDKNSVQRPDHSKDQGKLWTIVPRLVKLRWTYDRFENMCQIGWAHTKSDLDMAVNFGVWLLTPIKCREIDTVSSWTKCLQQMCKIVQSQLIDFVVNLPHEHECSYSSAILSPEELTVRPRSFAPSQT